MAILDNRLDELTPENFYSETEQGTHLVCFVVGWCSSCPGFKHEFQALSESYRGRVRFVLFNTWVEGEEGEKKEVRDHVREDHSLQGYPTCVLYKDGDIEFSLYAPSVSWLKYNVNKHI